MLKSKKGFTLVELCVAMGLFAIIASVVTATYIFIVKQNSDIQREASFISDVTDIRNKVNDWLNRYDSASYTITVSGNALTAKKGSSTATLTFDTTENALMTGGTKASETYKNVSGVAFAVLETRSDDNTIVEGKMARITVTAKKGGGTEQQTLLFPLFSDNTRTRSVTGKGLEG